MHNEEGNYLKRKKSVQAPETNEEKEGFMDIAHPALATSMKITDTEVDQLVRKKAKESGTDRYDATLLLLKENGIKCRMRKIPSSRGSVYMSMEFVIPAPDKKKNEESKDAPKKKQLQQLRKSTSEIFDGKKVGKIDHWVLMFFDILQLIIFILGTLIVANLFLLFSTPEVQDLKSSYSTSILLVILVIYLYFKIGYRYARIREALELRIVWVVFGITHISLTTIWSLYNPLIEWLIWPFGQLFTICVVLVTSFCVHKLLSRLIITSLNTALIEKYQFSEAIWPRYWKKVSEHGIIISTIAWLQFVFIIEFSTIFAGTLIAQFLLPIILSIFAIFILALILQSQHTLWYIFGAMRNDISLFPTLYDIPSFCVTMKKNMDNLGISDFKIFIDEKRCDTQKRISEHYPMVTCVMLWPRKQSMVLVIFTPKGEIDGNTIKRIWSESQAVLGEKWEKKWRLDPTLQNAILTGSVYLFPFHRIGIPQKSSTKRRKGTGDYIDILVDKSVPPGKIIWAAGSPCVGIEIDSSELVKIACTNTRTDIYRKFQRKGS